MANMLKFDQIVEFGQACDPPPQLEAKISKSQKLPFWPHLGFLP